jgi:hypothetical protein
MNATHFPVKTPNWFRKIYFMRGGDMFRWHAMKSAVTFGPFHRRVKPRPLLSLLPALYFNHGMVSRKYPCNSAIPDSPDSHFHATLTGLGGGRRLPFLEGLLSSRFTAVGVVDANWQVLSPLLPSPSYWVSRANWQVLSSTFLFSLSCWPSGWVQSWRCNIFQKNPSLFFVEGIETKVELRGPFNRSRLPFCW